MNKGSAVYLEARKCLLAIRSRVDELTRGIDPHPWGPISPAGKPGDHLTSNIRELAVYRRADLIFFRAMLSGSLTGWFLDGGERCRVPGWAWADQGGDWRAMIGGNRFLHTLLPELYSRWANCEVFADKAEFEAWFASDEIADECGFPELPSAYDEASRPALITSKAPPERPTVSLSEAVSWLAFGISLGSDTLHAALSGDAFGTDFLAVQARLRGAVDRLTTAGTGGLPMSGKMLRAGEEPDRALTEAIPPERFHDFRQFDVMFDGLRHGEGISWERTGPNAITRASLASSAQLRDVKVSRHALMKLRVSDAEYSAVPPLPTDDAIKAKVVELVAGGMTRDEAAKAIRREPGFERVGNEHARRAAAGSLPIGRRKRPAKGGS